VASVQVRHDEWPRIHYVTRAPKRAYPEGFRIVHNFYPGPPDDPGRDRMLGLDGFRAWVTDAPNANERRCYCGWLDGREHYGTVRVIELDDVAAV
jgi:hypothetical protein